MPSQQILAAPVVGGVTSRRHAKLLHHLFENNGGGNGGAPVKDLRLRRVVPPASAPPRESSPDCFAAADAAKPAPAVQIQAQSTPPEPSAAAAAEDRERKPLLPRSKLVRDPGSFGYRRLLPFLNKMAAKNGSDVSVCKDTPSETKLSVSTNKELSGSDSGLADESVDRSQGGAAPLDPVEPLAMVAVGDREVKDCCEVANISVSADPASSKPGLARSARSKFVHHPSSFSYKRMLPFLDIYSQGEDRAKIRRVSDEEQITSDENHVLASGHRHLAISEGSSKERNGAEVDRVVEEVASVSAEVQEATQGEALASVGDPLAPEEGELTSHRNAVPAGGEHQPAVSEDSPGERDLAEVETTVEERKASQSEENYVPVDCVEPLVAKAGVDQEMKDSCDTITEQTSKPCLTRSWRSRLVHQRNSFSYKRMLPFLMENGTSCQEGDSAKFQRVLEEKQLAPEESPVMASVHHDLSVSKDSAEACYRAEVEKIIEEIASAPYENYLLKGGQLQSAVAEVSPDGITVEWQRVTPELVLSSDKDELTSDADGVLASGQCELAVSGYLPKESSVAEAERIAVGEKTTKSDDNSVDLQPAVSEVSPQEGGADKDATQKPVLTKDGDEASGVTSDKGEFLVKDQPQLCDYKNLLQGKAEVGEVQQCQRSKSGCPDSVTVDVGADQQGAPERQDPVASPDGLRLDVGIICKPSDPCLEKQCLSPKKLFAVNDALSGVSCLKKRFLSPKKGILKRHTNGCKGICMCLDCSVFRLHADRAFEFSRKQMREADDIIGSLLEEVASLRSLAEKSSGQQEQIEEACLRASRVEEVARERQRQMQVELNAHCKIPGPRVKFAQYVDEKMASLPPGCKRSRQQPPL